MSDRKQQLIDLFNQTGQAHHIAFSDADGFDPEWPLWYASFLFDKLPPALKANMTQSEFVYLLIHLNKTQPDEAPDTDWQQYYASYLVQHYWES